MKYPEWLSPFIVSPNVPLRWYGTMYVLGFLASFLMLRHYIKKKEFKIPLEEEGGLYDLMMYIILGLMIGARVGNYILYSPEVFLSRPWEVLGLHYRPDGKFSHFALAGMSFHGGLAGVFLAVLIFLRRFNYKLSHLADWLVLSATPGLFFGRMGNFLNAELYGTKTTSAWGMKFPLYDKVGGYEKWIKLPAALRPYTQPRHASQLYEALLEGLLLMLILLWIKSRKPARGVMAWAFISFYGLFRTLVEFVREPSIAWSLGWFTSGMFYSVPMFLVGLVMIARLQSTKTSYIGDDSSPYRNVPAPKVKPQTNKGKPAKERSRNQEKARPEKTEESKPKKEEQSSSASKDASSSKPKADEGKKNTSQGGGSKNKKKKKKKK
ncbi:MAG: prolipoprotein diacylglyceryl transferase [Myxococcales bacterium]|nr:prolipoprotein diacylglyceryl transferase [Myxococcales bacterium]